MTTYDNNQLSSQGWEHQGWPSRGPRSWNVCCLGPWWGEAVPGAKVMIKTLPVWILHILYNIYMCVSLDFFVQVIPNYLKPKSNCLSIFKDEGWYGIDLKFVHIWCWSNVHDISQTSRETLGNGTVACCKAKSCSDGRGAPKAPRCPFCAWARTGWGDWIRLNIFVMLWLVGLIDLKSWKHLCWEIAHIHHGLLKGTSRVDLYFYIQAWRTWSRALVPPPPWWWKAPFTEVGHLILCGASKVDANYFRSSIVILKDLGTKITMFWFEWWQNPLTYDAPEGFTMSSFEVSLGPILHSHWEPLSAIRGIKPFNSLMSINTSTTCLPKSWSVGIAQKTEAQSFI